MRLGIDIDNVLTKTYEGIIREVNSPPHNLNVEFEDWITYDFWNCFPISEKETWKMFEHIIKKDFFLNLDAMPACRYVLKRYDFDTFLITSRRLSLSDQTKIWLVKNKIPHRDDRLHFVGSGSQFEKTVPSRYKRKAYLAKLLGLNCFIEDEGEVALEIASLGIPVILFNFPWNQHVNHQNIHRVGHWKDSCSYWREAENILRCYQNQSK